MFNALASPQKGSIPLTANMHRLGPGLPGYLIPFAPLAFVPQRQELSRDSPSPLVSGMKSSHFTARPSMSVSLPIFEPRSIQCHFKVERGDFSSNLRDRLSTLYA